MNATSATQQSTGGVCRAVTKASRSNFAYAFLVLPRAKREALYAIYAFCRISDDLVDEAESPAPAGPHPAAESAVDRLQGWRAELDACFRGAASHPVTQRLAEVLRAFPIPRDYFVELLNGMEMDLRKARYASFAELEQYCYRVAGVVGLMCIEVFGYTRPETRAYARNLVREVGSISPGRTWYVSVVRKLTS
jgi:15-cis-phytoene synthase